MNITFADIDWSTLSLFLKRQINIAREDTDVEVRIFHPSYFNKGNRVEGLYVDETLMGFANWTPTTGHLNNLYVSPLVRGLGLARQFMMERPLKSLYVMPRNEKAIGFYQSVGFEFSGKDLPARRHMHRLLAV